MIEQKHFDKTRTIRFSNLHDDIIDTVHCAMESAGLPEYHFAKWHGLQLVHDVNECDVYATLVCVDLIAYSVVLQCEDGAVMFNLDIFN